MAKETYLYSIPERSRHAIRRLRMRMRKCQKRPIIWQKRPITHTKETYRYIDIPELPAAPVPAVALANAAACTLDSGGGLLAGPWCEDSGDKHASYAIGEATVCVCVCVCVYTYTNSYVIGEAIVCVFVCVRTSIHPYIHTYICAQTSCVCVRPRVI